MPNEPLDFDAWLKLKGYDRARLAPGELNFLRSCWEAECKPASTLTAPAPSIIRAGATAPAPFRIAGAAGSAVAIRAEAGEGKLATFEGLAYSGAPMKPEGWWQPVIVDLAGVKVPSQHRPALRQHDHEQIVGHTTEVKADEGGIHVAGVLSGEKQHVDKVAVPAKNGFQWQLSIGANPTRTEFLEAGEETEVNGRTVTGPMTISRETEIGEISFVPLGADGDTSATVTAQRGRPTNVFKTMLKQLKAGTGKAAVKAAKYSDEDVDKMSEDDAKAALKKCMAEDEEDAEAAKKAKAKASDDEGEEEKKAEAAHKARIQARRKAEADELLRCDEVRARCKKHGVEFAEVELEGGKKEKKNLAAHAIAAGWTADQAELVALRAARPGPGVGIPGGLGYSSSPPELNEAVLEAAVLHGLRHQLLLEDDSFYFDAAPDGRTPIRRVPKRIQDEVQKDYKAKYTDSVQQAAHTHFRGRLGLHELLAHGMRGMGYTGGLELKSEQGIISMLKAWDHLDRSRSILAEGSSNASISNVLANVMNKFALQGYLFTEQAWREWVGIRPVNDFKATKSINLLGQTMFKKFGPSGELANFTLGDQAFANQAEPYGGIMTIPWTHLVNDDLGILGQVPMKVGQGAGLALNDAVYTLLASLAAGTLNGDDGVAFFRTGSALTDAAKKQGKAYKANKMSGGTSALSSDALKAAKALFDNQIDPNGNPLGFDGLMPILLFGPSNWVPAVELATYRELVYGGAAAAKQPQGNVWAGTMKPVMSRYVENASYVNSATAFFLMYNPVALAVVEACFLNGADTPAVLTAGPDYQFDRPGISIRGTMPFGVSQQNFRGGVYSVGS